MTISGSITSEGVGKENCTVKNVKQWIEENPLLVFRKNQGLSRMVFASLVGVSVSAVQSWECGANTPKPEHFEALANVMGRDIEREWKEWLSKKPQFTLE